MSDFNITVNAGQPLRLLTAGKYCDWNIVVEAIGGGDPMTTPFIVRAPTGSIITMSKGDVLKTEVSVDGKCVFTGLDPGRWNVTFSLGDAEKDAIVEIAFPSMEFSMDITLYDLVDIPEASGGWVLTTYSGYQLIQSTFNGVVNIKAQGGGSGSYLTANDYDVSGFKKLIYKCGIGGTGEVKVVVMPVGATGVDAAAASKSVTTYTTSPTVQEEMDISGLSGRYQIGLTVKSNGSIINSYMAFMRLE